MSDEESWDARERRIIAENVAKFNRQMDRDIEREMGIPARIPDPPRKGVSLEKSAVTREVYTGITVEYDSAARREAIAEHLRRAGVSKEAQLARMLLEVGQAAPARDIEKERRDAASRGALMRERESPNRGIERGRND